MNPVVIAQALLAVSAVGFTPQEPVTFKSGLKSPVYVDNRRLPFWPQQWRVVIEGFQHTIAGLGIAFDVIAGIEVGGIPHSSALAYSLQKASVFVRKQAKEHGKQQRIEGGEVAGKRVLLIEDLVTTGGSSLSGVEALKEAGAGVEDCIAIVSYGFAEARLGFEAAGVRLHSLVPFSVIVEEAARAGLLSEDNVAVVRDWLNDPYAWMEKHGFQV